MLSEDRSGVGPVRSGPGPTPDRSGPRSKNWQVFGLRSSRSGPGPMNTPTNEGWSTCDLSICFVLEKTSASYLAIVFLPRWSKNLCNKNDVCVRKVPVVSCTDQSCSDVALPCSIMGLRDCNYFQAV